MTLLPYAIDQLGVTVHKHVEDAIRGADVVDILRIQLERQSKGLFPSAREYARIYGVNEERMKLAASRPHEPGTGNFLGDWLQRSGGDPGTGH